MDDRWEKAVAEFKRDPTGYGHGYWAEAEAIEDFNRTVLKWLQNCNENRPGRLIEVGEE